MLVPLVWVAQVYNAVKARSAGVGAAEPEARPLTDPSRTWFHSYSESVMPPPLSRITVAVGASILIIAIEAAACSGGESGAAVGQPPTSWRR